MSWVNTSINPSHDRVLTHPYILDSYSFLYRKMKWWWGSFRKTKKKTRRRIPPGVGAITYRPP